MRQGRDSGDSSILISARRKKANQGDDITPWHDQLGSPPQHIHAEITVIVTITLGCRLQGPHYFRPLTLFCRARIAPVDGCLQPAICRIPRYRKETSPVIVVNRPAKPNVRSALRTHPDIITILPRKSPQMDGCSNNTCLYQNR